MCLLILGGTAWLGRHLVLEALRAGHAVTCLARARSGPVPDGATWVQADRDDDRAFEAVRLNDWDAVIELARQPGQVRAAAQALAGRCRTYVFISSTSVYADTETLDQDEQAPVVPPLETDSFQTPADYAAGKVACENHARRAFGASALVVRPGLIGGPGDETGRSGYWPRRFWQAAQRGQPVLVPDVDGLMTQVIDVRDLARWVVAAASGQLTGTFNATGRAVPLAGHLRVAQQEAGFTGPLRKVSPAWLQAKDVAPWAGARSLPLWLPLPSHAGFGARSARAALEQGLALRPLGDTLRDTLAWELQDARPWPRQAGLSDADEHELLERLQALSD
jgi:2'-hydroxyisoflavone reductase